MDYQEGLNQIVEKSEENKKRGGFLYSFLLGAGASVSSHIPDGQTMCKNLIDKYTVQEHEIEEKRKQGMTNYQAVLSIVRKKTQSKFISQYIREMILSNARRPAPDYRWIVNNCYNTLANILVERPYFSRTVFTTNFDPLLYYAFVQNWNVEPVLIRHHQELDTMLPKQVYEEFPCLIYLHGYWQNHQLYHEPKQLKIFANKWVNKLLDWLEHDIIVIGYSGLEDSIALKWLQKCLANNASIWWCIYSPDGNLEYEQCHSIESKLDVEGGDLNFISIRTADKFAIDLGKKLGLRQATEIACLTNLIPWFNPNNLSYFSNGANLKHNADDELTIHFRMGSDTFPGNNHAGLNIDSVQHQVNIERFQKIILNYNIVFNNSKLEESSFEFKLHSKSNAWSYHVPIKKVGPQVHPIPLEEFAKNGVDLRAIWRIVIAADVNCLGMNDEAKITISEVELQ